MYESILGRVSVHDVIHPITGEVIVRSGEEIREDAAKAIEESPIESVEIRSVLLVNLRRVSALSVMDVTWLPKHGSER